MLKSRALGSATLSVALMFCLAACGDDGGDESTGDGDQSGDGDTGDGDGAIPTLNGCPASAYEDHTAASDGRVIAIAQGGLTYTPRCMTIAVGQTVRWEGSLSAHPLAKGNADDGNAGSANSPIANTSSGQSVEFTFAAPGTYPYYCTVHGFGSGMGMSGSIHVQ